MVMMILKKSKVVKDILEGSMRSTFLFYIFLSINLVLPIFMEEYIFLGEERGVTLFFGKLTSYGKVNLS